MFEWTSSTNNIVALVLLCVALLLLLLLCILSIIFCRKRKSDWACDSVMQPPIDEDDSYCFNSAFDIEDETSVRRIDERMKARQMKLFCEDPHADLTLKRMDRSVGAALAVEQLLRDSYVFDTRIMPRPKPDVEVIAAKRDYL